MDKLRVVVVGAGAAGLAAAARLLECGVRNVVILEAEDRMGGRIHTTLFGKQFCCCTLILQLLLQIRNMKLITFRYSSFNPNVDTVEILILWRVREGGKQL
jgi:phytoene dehydrogenase-like protein